MSAAEQKQILNSPVMGIFAKNAQKKAMGVEMISSETQVAAKKMIDEFKSYLADKLTPKTTILSFHERHWEALEQTVTVIKVRNEHDEFEITWTKQIKKTSNPPSETL